MKLHLLCLLQIKDVQRTTTIENPRTLLTFTITTTTTTTKAIIMTDKLLMYYYYLLRIISHSCFSTPPLSDDSDGDMPIFDKQK